MLSGKSHKKSKWLESGLVLVVLSLVLLFFAVNYLRNWNKSREINKEISNLNQEVKKLEGDNLQLTELIKYLNSTAFLEEKARTDLGLKKEGEKTIILSNFGQNATSSDQTSNNQQGQDSNFRKWWRYFFAHN